MSLATCILFVALIFLSVTILGTRSESLVENTSTLKLDFKSEKLTHFHFYIHDIFGGPNYTDVNVATRQPTGNTTTTADAFFGRVDVLDIPLTVSPDIGSKRVGSMQGIVAGVSLSEQLAYSMVISFVFTEGKYNGSTLIMVGRNQATFKVRELPIIGGSGVFRFARGYALTSTYSPFDPKIGIAVYEYDLYALHY